MSKFTILNAFHAMVSHTTLYQFFLFDTNAKSLKGLWGNDGEYDQ